MPILLLDQLLEAARQHQWTDAEIEEHARSFALGNVAMHNPAITRADIDRAADELGRVKPR